MNEEKKIKWKKWLSITGWTMLGVAAVVLLVSAIDKKRKRLCKGLDVEIVGAGNIMFVDRSDVIAQVKNQYKMIEQVPVESVDLRDLEERLKKNVWINNAELFFDNNDVLQIKLWEREPIARIITISGNSFYLDSSSTFVPLSDKFSARVPVFSNFPVEKMVTHADSIMLSEVKELSTFILNDPFWMAQVSQVDITPGRTFEIIPTIGNHLIIFGDADNCRQKFDRLFTFYKEVLSKTGLNKYAVLNVSYNDQVVALKKDKLAIKADSAQAIKLMEMLSASVNKMMMDSISSAIDVPELPVTNDTPAIIPNPVVTAPAKDTAGAKRTATISPSKLVLMKTNPVKASATNVAAAKPLAKPPVKTNTTVPVKQNKPVVMKPAAAKKIVKAPVKTNTNQKPVIQKPVSQQY